MRKLICLFGLALCGCSASLKPIRTYDADWCKLSEFVTPEGDRVFIYNGTRGVVMHVVPKR